MAGLAVRNEDAHEVGVVLGPVQDPVLAQLGRDRRRRVADKPKACNVAPDPAHAAT
jgi:hypothetical protein